ncbi:hypothetical protein QWJ26_39250 [Streptomyces sp. CSDS2]|uniref:hypothetical protein n=1 Tax=Streptomyces sp. CSDS2 TaxID=3055051 RepID=UPI0025B25771|nr:hypothetical protein [Streptomyces sp. CSDS2]MDN3265737.1 hypothetical protein [Streptomyces sp. CSDS2]
MVDIAAADEAPALAFRQMLAGSVGDSAAHHAGPRTARRPAAPLPRTRARNSPPAAGTVTV